jgi:hypothetical protein
MKKKVRLEFFYMFLKITHYCYYIKLIKNTEI